MILVGPGANTDPKPKFEFDELPSGLPPGALIIHIHRDMFSDYVTLTLANGYTEELHWEEVRDWFKQRGANMDAAEKALDYAWNFKDADFVIQHPKNPIENKGRHTPKL